MAHLFVWKPSIKHHLYFIFYSFSDKSFLAADIACCFNALASLTALHCFNLSPVYVSGLSFSSNRVNKRGGTNKVDSSERPFSTRKSSTKSLLNCVYIKLKQR